MLYLILTSAHLSSQQMTIAICMVCTVFFVTVIMPALIKFVKFCIKVWMFLGIARIIKKYSKNN